MSEEYERMYELAVYIIVNHGSKLKSMTAIQRGCVYYNVAKKYNISNYTLFKTIITSLLILLEDKSKEIDELVEWVSKGCPVE